MKKIIILEDKINQIKNMINESSERPLLPNFIFDRVKVHNTSLGENEAFPVEDYYPFDYKILKNRYIEVCENLVNVMGENSFSEDELISELSSLMKICREKERPIRENLIKVCENAVADIFSIPEETIILQCELVDKVNPSHPFRVMPEDTDNTDYVFNDLEDAKNSSRVIMKRRLINSLIQGASYVYAKENKIALDEIYNLDEELPLLYEKIIVINDYLLFTKQENITDEKPMQGGCVDVELGRLGDKTIIKAQGLIFPCLLTETLRGFFELFASHGLPKDIAKAKFIMSKSDFLMAEPWDLRFGVGLWKKLTRHLEETQVVPFFFMNLVSLHVEEFNETLKEIFAKTKKGEELSHNLYLQSKIAYNKQDFNNMIDKKNSEVSLINDDYLAADEIDDYMIEEDGLNDVSFDNEKDEYIELIKNCSSDDLYIDLELVDGSKEHGFHNATVSIDGVDLPLYIVDLKCETITTSDGELLYVPHIDIMPRYQHIGLGYKIFKAFVECVGNICRSETSTRNHDEMPKIYDKLNSEPNIEVEDYGDENGNVTYRVARLKQSIHENRKEISMGGRKLLYMHKSQAKQEIPQELYTEALTILNEQFPEYDYFNCLMYDPKNQIIRFDYSEDFDTCSEPSVQRRVAVDLNNKTATEGKRGVDVWHGKGDFWVDDSYKGFDVNSEKAWRQRYLDVIKTKSQYGKTPHGESRGNWLNHLIDLGLIDEYFERNNITDPIEYLKANSTGKFKNGLLIQKYEEFKRGI